VTFFYPIDLFEGGFFMFFIFGLIIGVVNAHVSRVPITIIIDFIFKKGKYWYFIILFIQNFRFIIF